MKKKKYIIPFLTIFCLLVADAFVIARLNNVKHLNQSGENFQIPMFMAHDLEGNVVTEDIFKDKFTVVCLWVVKDADGSRKILSELQDWKNTSDKTFQLVGIAGDIGENADLEQIEKARMISRNIDILQITANDDLRELLSRIRHAPTVFFTDENGVVIGQPVAGNELELIKKEAARLMDGESSFGKIKAQAQRILFHSP